MNRPKWSFSDPTRSGYPDPYEHQGPAGGTGIVHSQRRHDAGCRGGEPDRCQRCREAELERG